MAKPTITYLEDDSIGEKCGHNFKLITGVLRFGAYETAGTGVSCDLSNQLPTKVHQVIIEPKGGYVPVYNYSTKRILIYQQRNTASTALTELAAQTDLGTAMSDTRFTAIGK